ncbi:MAG: hypothetical protein LQ346_000214, partial [Caloplaca aetnensis]
MHLYSLRLFAIFRSAALVSLCYFALLRPIARAAGGNTTIHQDHNHHRLLGLHDHDITYLDRALKASNYEPDFAGVDRGIIGRAEEDVTPLTNNAPKPMNISQGEIQYWSLSKDILQGPPGRAPPSFPLNATATNRSRLEEDLLHLPTQSNHTGNPPSVWLTISTCDQPSKSVDRTATPPPLEVYVSRSPSNPMPDNGRSDEVVAMDGGYGNTTLSKVTGGIWVGVRAPESTDFSGHYNYELAASIDASYATYFNLDNTSWDNQIESWDTDPNSSILATGNITNAWADSRNFTAWLDMIPPFTIYVIDQADSWTNSLNRSVCGLKKHARIRSKPSDNSMVNIGGQPKQLFYVEGLDRSSSYHAFMTLERGPHNTTLGGGGAVWSARSFTTKS